MAKSERSKKSKVLTSVAAVVLAVSMIIGGGTYAYLEAESDDVVNTFNTEKVAVELSESGDQQYSILPGTSEDKDPTVKVTNSVDAYVYVTVEDTTQGLVDYEIADGWLPLDGFTNVYYREVAPGETPDVAKEFPVLKDNKVSYDAALTNANMEGKEDLKLTFKAYAIQKAPFNEPVAAWEGKDTEFVKNQDDLLSALEESTQIEIVQDVNISTPINTEYNMQENTVMDLNGNEMLVPHMTAIFQGENIKIQNGTMIMDDTGSYPIFIGNGTQKTSAVIENVKTIGGVNVYVADCILKDCYIDASSKKYYAVWADEGATITIESGTYISGTSGIAVSKAEKDSEVIIKGGTFNSDVSQFVADGYKVETSTDESGTWYTVVPA